MKSLEEIRAELIAAFDDKEIESKKPESGLKDQKAPVKGLRVDGKLLSQSPHFNDYLRIGHYLSYGPRAPISGEPVIRNALIKLDEDMTQRINKYYSAKSRAIDYFQKQEAAYKAKAPPEKDSDYSKLLTASLDEFERAHGFMVVGERLPNYAGFVFGNVFKESLALKQHWKDVGAGEKHGEYTHRLQWYILIRAGAIKTVPVNQEATIFASIAPWQKGRTCNLWTFLLDLLVTDTSIGNDALDFRSPENLNMWLVGDSSPEFCPVLRAFLRARMAKRKSLYNMRDYLVKKLKKSEKEVDEIMTFMQTESMENRNASARIAFPKGANPKFDPYVKT
ncbi:hypothetical protein LMG28688_03332 [Paraburkholderia caffeinitolerans]|uniref:DUF5636 domain-containing protein n=1 Tax=Paraburkholderia caffeinitolerans TaxID=1723730 RepID=A0A6J5G4Z3_9BURK|nr:LirA/MavJ family T4SS effector [Paraburkholderia caffeinitolerans]CAB3791582.1 hypothetical protein LMG28688_03332 [Paraburkholderia caffeinitolerans]